MPMNEVFATSAVSRFEEKDFLPPASRRTFLDVLIIGLVVVVSMLPVSVESFSCPTTTRIKCVRSARIRCFHDASSSECEHNNDDNPRGADPSSNSNAFPSNRRTFLRQGTVLATIGVPLAARAGVAELDKSTGSLYSPKNEMLSGGSNAARGIRTSTSNGPALKPGQALQTVYETRFIAYLSRFLINFDPAANAWWVKNALNGQGELSSPPSSSSSSSAAAAQSPPSKAQLDFKFAEFAESVEIGLADYFVGPYGSYSSLVAMKAGLNAKIPARSLRPDDDVNDVEGIRNDNRNSNSNGAAWNILGNLFSGATGRSRTPPSSTTIKINQQRAKRSQDERDKIAKQGVLNLYSLLKARYQSRTAKRQLAILFSFFSNPNLQPTAEIKSLLGEVDNCTITNIEIVKPFSSKSARSIRTSSQRGGGYSYAEPPTVTIEPPPALGSSYASAKGMPIMKRTSRILKIRVLDGGNGYYNKAPEVYVDSPGGLLQQPCQATAVLNRQGGVESVVVLDPGFGYGQRNGLPPAVKIAQPEYRGIKQSGRNRQALAKAYLEYECCGIELTRGGNGYVASEPPAVTISPPEENPDWYVDLPDLVVSEFNELRAQVSEMRGPKGNLAYSIGAVTTPDIKLPLQRVRENPAELLPSAVRPILNSYGTYVIPDIAAIRTYDDIMDNPRFRAVDPLFGAIGTVPAQKSALELQPSEYGRLALSGAVCTVLVRTALNPLELIKTKQQLQNDKELFAFARKAVMNPEPSVAETMLANSFSDGNELSLKSDQGGDMRGECTSSNCTDKDSETTLAVVTKPSATTAAASEEAKPQTVAETVPENVKVGSKDLLVSLVKLRGPAAAFQSADITLLASLIFGSLGFGATEFYRRSFTMAFFSFDDGTPNQLNTELVLLLAAAVATILTSAAAAPFELLRVRSMGLVESKVWIEVMKDFLNEKSSSLAMAKGKKCEKVVIDPRSKDFDFREIQPLWAGFGPTASRELAFAIPKFLVFDLIAHVITGFINSEQLGPGALPIQVGVGSTGLLVSAFSGALAGLAGAFVSHPADLILTYTSASKTKMPNNSTDLKEEGGANSEADWKDVVKELLSKEGGVANLFVGLTPRLIFFFLVIGLQFFLYDYVKNVLQVGSDDLSLVLDVFYSVRQGLVDST